VVPADGQHHVIDPFLEDGVDDADGKEAEHVQVAHHLQQGILRKQLADGQDDRPLPDLGVIEDDGGDVEDEADSKHHQQLVLHRVGLVDEGLKVQAVDDDADPDELVNGLLDAEPQLLAAVGIAEGEEVDVDEGEEQVFLAIVGGEDGDDLDHHHHEYKQHQVVLVLKELEDDGFASRSIDLVRVDQPQTAKQIDKVEGAVEGVEGRPIDILEIAPIPGEVVVGIG
jgi:hypothetical protein